MMLQTKTQRCATLQRRNARRPTWTRSRPKALIVAASGQWTFGGILEALRDAVIPKEPTSARTLQPASKQLLQELTQLNRQDVGSSVPSTFQQLNPQLTVLLDPKNDRLVYLVGVDEDGSTDGTVAQVRALLRATAAPYLHLLALPDHLHRSLLREFPGGAPIITRVPLPAEASADGDADAADGAAGTPGTAGDAAERLRGGGSVLDFLYGAQHVRRPGLPGATRPAGDGPLGREDAGGSGDGISGDGLESPADLPDEVMSRRKKVPHIMDWRKGASTRVALRRESRSEYKYEWLVETLNRLGHGTAFLASPNLMFVRNNIVEHLATDDMSGMLVGEGVPWRVGGGDEVDEEEEEEDSDDGEEDGVRAARGAAGDSDDEEEEDDDEEWGDDEAPAERRVVVLDGEDTADLASLLKAIGLIDDSDGDSDDAEDDAEGEGPKAGQRRRIRGLLHSDSEEDSEGEEEPNVEGTAAAASDKSKSNEDADSDAEEADEEEEEEEEGEAGLRSAFAAIRALLSQQRGGPGAGGPPEVVIRMPGAGDEDDEEDDDPPFNMDLPLSSGPMGWTVAVRVRPDKDKDADAGAGRRGGAGGREPAPEALRADAEYLSNMLRLEAQWLKQSALEDLAREQQQQREQREEGAPAPSDGAASGAAPAGAAERGVEKAGAEAVDVTAGAADAGGSGINMGLGEAGGSIEDDWRMAELRAAADATTTGRARYRPSTSGGAAAGGVPTDRLVRPARRPATPTPADAPEVAQRGPTGAAEGAASPADVGASSSQDAANGPSCSRRQADAAGDGEAPSPGLPAVSSADGEADDIVSSTRHRRDAEGSGSASDSGDDATGSAPGSRPTGRSRMIRRPRFPARHTRSAPDGSTSINGSRPPEGPAASTAPTGRDAADAASSGSAAASAPDGAGSAGAAGGALSIPVYRHMRSPSAGSANGAAAGAHAPPSHAPTGKPMWGRLGPGQVPPAAGSGNAGNAASAGSGPSSGGAAAGGGGPAPMLPPEAAGYAALDMEQLAHFVHGRQATPEEVQELARTVAQEDTPAVPATPPPAPPPPPSPSPVQTFGFGGIPSRYHWRRPGTPLPSIREILSRPSRCRRGAVKPRRERLRIPPPVLSLAKRQAAAAAATAAAAEAASRAADSEQREREEEQESSAGQAAAAASSGSTAAGPADRSRQPGPSILTLRRVDGPRGVEVVELPSSGPRSHPLAPLRSTAVAAPTAPVPPTSHKARREAAVQAAAAALRDAGPQVRRRVDALLAFLRGRPPPCGGGDAPAGDAGVGDCEPEAPLLGRRAGARQVGVARGRDAVVVLPRGLLLAAAGAWQAAEERLMHPEVLRSRTG